MESNLTKDMIIEAEEEVQDLLVCCKEMEKQMRIIEEEKKQMRKQYRSIYSYAN